MDIWGPKIFLGIKEGIIITMVALRASQSHHALNSVATLFIPTVKRSGFEYIIKTRSAIMRSYKDAEMQAMQCKVSWRGRL